MEKLDHSAEKNDGGLTSQKQMQLLEFTDDLIEEILVRVPAETLLSSKCVCVRWRRLISDPSFFSKLVQHPKSLPPIITGFFTTNLFTDSTAFFPTRHPKEASFIAFGNQIITGFNLSKFSKLDFLQGCIAVLSSHDELLLCAKTSPINPDDAGYLVFYVCNPLTKISVPIPEPPIFQPGVKNTVLFCYDRNVEQESHGGVGNKEFKLLFFSVNSGAFLQMYSSEKGTWSDTLNDHESHEFSPFSDLFVHTIFDGCFYLWDPPSGSSLIYDFKEEKTRSEKLPTLDLKNSYHFANLFHVLGVSSGSLYYAETNWTYFRTCFNVWVLVDGGLEWCLKHHIDTFTSALPFEPLAFHPLNYRLILVMLESTRVLALYHMDRLSIEIIKNINHNEFYPVVPYSFRAWPPCLEGYEKLLREGSGIKTCATQSSTCLVFSDN